MIPLMFSIARRFQLAVFLCTVTVAGMAQDVVREATPLVNLDAFRDLYLSIEFSPEQRDRLSGRQLELHYLVDALGQTTLQTIKGISDRDILDSLYRRSGALPAFEPKRINGEPQASIYRLKVSFPRHASGNVPIYERPLSYADFEYIDKEGPRMEILIAGVVNTFAGPTSAHLNTGGGAKLDLLITSPRKIGAGIVMGLNVNHLKNDYPISTQRWQEPDQLSFYLGIGLHKVMLNEERREVALQLELNYAGQNLVAAKEYDDYYVQIHGFSPAVVVHYLHRVGRQRIQSFGEQFSIRRSNINFHFAIRPLFTEYNSTSGIMFDFGIGYRPQSLFVREYRLRRALD